MLTCTTRQAHSMFSPIGDPILPEGKIKEFTGLTNKPKDTYVSTSIFLHGEIENLLGFDIPLWLEGDYSTDFNDGIHPINVILGEKHDYKTIECLIYLWKDETKTTIWDASEKKSMPMVKHMGFIITNDSKTKDYVMEKFEKRSTMI